MRSRAPLALMEQMVMLLVFALAAALCLQAFVRSDGLSRRSEERSRAVVLCQNAAEAIRAAEGDFQEAAALLGTELWNEDSLSIFYGADWQMAAPQSPGVYPFGYTLGVSRRSAEVPGLGEAQVWMKDDESGDELFRIQVAWQEEVSGRG